jgi:hypothetical protein
MNANGPAIWGGCVTRRKHRVESWYSSQKAVTVQALPAGRQGGYGACFCRPGANFIEHYVCRGTSLIGAANLSPVTKLVAGTGPAKAGVQIVSEPDNCQGAEFKLRADERIQVQRPLRICLGCRSTCLPAGRKAKTVTNNLPILSVLYVVFYPFYFVGLNLIDSE